MENAYETNDYALMHDSGRVELWIDWNEKVDGDPEDKISIVVNGSDLVVLKSGGEITRVIKELGDDVLSELNSGVRGAILFNGERGVIAEHDFVLDGSLPSLAQRKFVR